MWDQLLLLLWTLGVGELRLRPEVGLPLSARHEVTGLEDTCLPLSRMLDESSGSWERIEASRTLASILVSWELLIIGRWRKWVYRC
jgi:hypothetical protein